MSELRRVGDLDLNQDLDHEARESHFQSIGWATVLLVLAAGLAGLFGNGALSSRVAGQPESGFRVEYQRFERRHSESRLQLHLAPATARNGVVRLWISRSFLDRVAVDRIEPEPQSRTLSSDRIVYEFPMSSQSDTSGVILLFRPDTMGPLSTTLGVENGPELHLWQFVYP